MPPDRYGNRGTNDLERRQTSGMTGLTPCESIECRHKAIEVPKRTLSSGKAQEIVKAHYKLETSANVDQCCV
jgi:hypothetical protein